MSRVNRSEVVHSGEVGVFHCLNRCVRRAYLCGRDERTWKSFDHRKEWLERRFRQLSRVFAVDLVAFAVMSNHFHAIVRTRPDVVSEWSDRDVARRWLSLTVPHVKRTCSPVVDDVDALPEPEAIEIDALCRDKRRLAVIRERLSDISWWMRYVTEPLARRANKEDDCTGRFWEGRFKCSRLADDAAILAAMAYVDLNPVRAGIAKTPEASDHTSAQRRAEALQSDKSSTRTNTNRNTTSRHDKDKVKKQGRPDRFLAPLQLDERAKPGPKLSATTSRCSDKGVLPITVEKYLVLLDLTGRELKRDKHGKIADDAAPILERLGIDGEQWLVLVKSVRRLYPTVAGSTATITQERRRDASRYRNGGGNLLSRK
jgi:REP element-mobilizing transposase RayT